MLPNVFVSSTIEDLHHLRDAIRDALRELSYNPVMSEFGDVGYVPNASAEESCYRTIKDCQIVVVFIGKRYGSLSRNGLSVTHNEYSTAREQKKYTIFLVDHEVMSFKKVFDNRDTKAPHPRFPGMDDPSKTFQLIDEIRSGAENNAIIAYQTVSEARDLLKKQLAMIFADLLRNRFDSLKGDVKDILSELMTLRRELAEKGEPTDRRSLAAFRFLLDDDNSEYRRLLERTLGPIDSVLPLLLEAHTFDELVSKAGIEITLRPIASAGGLPNGCLFLSDHVWGRAEPGQGPPTASWAVSPAKKVAMNKRAKDMFDWLHEQFRLAVGPAQNARASAHAGIMPLPGHLDRHDTAGCSPGPP